MSLYRLDRLFAPRSVAVVGATDRPRSMGQALMANMVRAGFAGQLLPVNPKHRTVAGREAFASLSSLPAVPDLVVMATPGATIPALVEEAARLGVPAAVVISALDRLFAPRSPPRGFGPLSARSPASRARPHAPRP